MSLNQKFLAQVRAATRSLLRRGPAVTRTVIEESVKNANAVQAAAVKSAESLTPPPAPAPASNQSSYDAISDMLADLSRMSLESNPFIAPLRPTGTATAGLSGRFIDASYTNEAGTRDYKLYVPGSYADQPAPLVVMLHGCTQNPDDFALGTGMNQLAEEYGCLVAYPAQAQHANASRCWNWFSAADQQRDQGEPSIIAGLTRDIMARYAIDPSQVFVAGLSAGGAMAAIMGTQYPDLYAAVGVHSGLPFAAAHDLASAMAAMKGDFRTHHKPNKSLPIIVFHGDRDTTVHPANGDELIKRRRRHPAEDIVVEGGAVPDGHAYTRTVHRKPDGSIHAEHWVIHGSGHAWSGGDTRGTYTDGRGPNASREMMRFFRTAR
jgi:poly(hydroxyalkanoate) depolymerase family esterase